VILGLIVNADYVYEPTREFLVLKRTFFPKWFTRGPALDRRRST
jgi:hypothetical protein